MKKTPNLDLPIYDNPEEDFFDLSDWNIANDNIDKAYSEVINTKDEVINIKDEVINIKDEVINIKDEIPRVNANAEIIEARKGAVTLKDKIDLIDSSLETNTKQLDEKINEVASTGTTKEIIQNKISEMAKDGTITFNTVEPEMTTFIRNIGAKNIYKPNGFVDNSRVNQNGQLVKNENYCFTLNVVDVEPNKNYSFSIKNGTAPIAVRFLVQKEYGFLDDFRLNKFEERKTSITTVEKTNFLGLTFEKHLLVSHGGEYNTINDFLNDLVIQQSDVNEEIKGNVLEDIKVPYLDVEISNINKNLLDNNVKLEIAKLSSTTLFDSPVNQFSNGLVNYIAMNPSYGIVNGEIISTDKDNKEIEKIIINDLDAWDSVNSNGILKKQTFEIILKDANIWRNEISDSDNAISFGLWINIKDIIHGNVEQGEAATFKVNSNLFKKTYGNVKPTENTMAYGNYTEGLGQVFYISILKENLQTLDINGAKKYLSDNDIKIKVKLEGKNEENNLTPIIVTENGFVKSVNLDLKCSQMGVKKSNLHGKTFMTLGDSLTALGVWQKYVMKNLGIKSLVNLAVGGQKVSRFAEKVTSENIKDVDLVIVMGYFNSYACADGTSQDLASNDDNASIWSGYKYIINKLKTLKPTVDIVIMSAHKPAPPNNTDSRAKLVKEIALYYSLPFIDIHNVGGFNEYTFKTYLLDDTIHSSNLGYEKEGSVITGGLINIFG